MPHGIRLRGPDRASVAVLDGDDNTGHHGSAGIRDDAGNRPTRSPLGKERGRQDQDEHNTWKQDNPPYSVVTSLNGIEPIALHDDEVAAQKAGMRIL